MNIGDNFSQLTFTFITLGLVTVVSLLLVISIWKKSVKRFAAIFIILFLGVGVIGYFLPQWNQDFDETVDQEIALLSTTQTFDNDNCVYPILKDGTRINKNFCYSEYRNFEKDEFLVIKGKGFFGVPWIRSVGIRRYHDFTNFFSSFEKFSDMRYFQAENFFRIHGTHHFDHLLPGWEENCSKKEAEFCRALSYVLIMKGNRTRLKELFKRGCELNDEASCVSFFHNPEFTEKEKNWAKKKMAKLSKRSEKK